MCVNALNGLTSFLLEKAERRENTMKKVSTP